jgi:hypothetical protein
MKLVFLSTLTSGRVSSGSLLISDVGSSFGGSALELEKRELVWSSGTEPEPAADNAAPQFLSLSEQRFVSGNRSKRRHDVVAVRVTVAFKRQPAKEDISKIELKPPKRK